MITTPEQRLLLRFREQTGLTQEQISHLMRNSIMIGEPGITIAPEPRKLKKGDKVRVLRNTCHANHPNQNRRLEAGDAIVLKDASEETVTYTRDNGKINFIYTKDVEFLEEEPAPKPRKLKKGDKVRVLRNTCHANRPDDRSRLGPGDIVVVRTILQDRVTYSLDDGIRHNYIYTKDVEFLEEGPKDNASDNPIDIALKTCIYVGSAIIFLTMTYVTYRAHPLHLPPLLERINMNLGSFFTLPFVQDANQAAYAAVLALLGLNGGLLTLRHAARSIARGLDRRRTIRAVAEDRHREISRLQTEAMQQGKREFEESRLLAQRRKDEEREREIRMILQPILERIQVPGTVPATATVPASIPASPSGPAKTGYYQFFRDATNGAKYYDPVTKQVRTAKKGDLVHIIEWKEATGSYRTYDGCLYHALYSDVRLAEFQPLAAYGTI